MPSMLFDRGGIDDVADRHGYDTASEYLSHLLNVDDLTAHLNAMSSRLSPVLTSLGSFSTSTLTPTALSSTKITVKNASNDYVTISGSHFGPITSSGSINTKFANFEQAIDSFDGNRDATLSSITYGHGSKELAKLTLSSTKIVLSAGSDSLTISGHFPTKLGQVYDSVEDMLHLNAAHPTPDPATFKFYQLPSNSPLFDYDVSSMTLKAGSKTLLSASFNDHQVKVTAEGGLTITVNGHFPDNAGDAYNAVAQVISYDRTHVVDGLPTLDLAESIASSAKLHHYDVDSISLKMGSKTIGSATWSDSKISITAGDYKLTASGHFPHDAGDLVALLSAAEHGKPVPTSYKLTDIKLVDTHDNSTLAHVGGPFTGTEAAQAFGSLALALGEDAIVGTTGNDTLKGGAHADTIVGSSGSDTLTGGTGKDHFVFYEATDSTPNHADTITDFKSGDKLEIEGSWKLDTGGSFANHEVRQTLVNHGHDLKLEFNFDSDSTAEMSLTLLNHGTFAHISDFIA